MMYDICIVVPPPASSISISSPSSSTAAYPSTSINSPLAGMGGMWHLALLDGLRNRAPGDPATCDASESESSSFARCLNEDFNEKRSILFCDGSAWGAVSPEGYLHSSLHDFNEKRAIRRCGAALVDGQVALMGRRLCRIGDRRGRTKKQDAEGR